MLMTLCITTEFWMTLLVYEMYRFAILSLPLLLTVIFIKLH